MTVRAPAGLGPRGRTAWRNISSKFDLRPDEAELLVQLCRCLDRAESLRKAMNGQPYLIDAPRDGQKINPLLIEERQQVEQARKLALALRLPDTDRAYGDGTGQPSGPWSSRSHRREAG